MKIKLLYLFIVVNSPLYSDYTATLIGLLYKHELPGTISTDTGIITVSVRGKHENISSFERSLNRFVEETSLVYEAAGLSINNNGTTIWWSITPPTNRRENPLLMYAPALSQKAKAAPAA